MAGKKTITNLNELTSAASADVLPIVDVSDTSVTSTGETKKITFSNLNSSLTGITTSQLAAASVVTESEGIASNDNDTTLPTSAAVKDYVDTNVTAQDLDFQGDGGTGAVDLDSQSLDIAGGTNITTAASSQTLTVNLDSTISGLTSVTSTGFTGDLTGNVTGNTSGSSGSCTGNSATATSLETARTIAGTSFNGTGNIDIEAAGLKSTSETSGTKFLREDGDGTCSWQAVAGSGTVSSVGGTGTVNGLTLTGTVTSTGNLTLGGTLSVNLASDVTGTLPVANGGTGLTSISTLLNSNTTASDVGLGSVENTALSTWAGTSSITTLGTIATGTWNGTAIDGAYVDIEATEIKSTGELGGTKFLREDGDGTCSWQTVSGGGSGTVTSITPAADTGSGSAITSSGTLTSTGGDGVATSVSGTTTTFALDLKANGGAVIESNELAVDLAASSITGTLAASDGGTGLASISTLLNSNVTPTSLGLVIDTNVQAYDADTAKTDVVQTFTAGQRGEVTTLSSVSGSVAIELDDSNNFSLTMTDFATTLANPTSTPVAGQSGCIVITQDSFGSSYTLDYGTQWHFEGGTHPTLSTGANDVDTLAYYVASATSIQAVLLKDMS